MNKVHEMLNAPTVMEYVRTITTLAHRVTNNHRALFCVHYHAPERTATAKQLADWVGLRRWSIVNSLYGKLGHAVCDELGIRPRLRPNSSYQWWSVWSRGWQTPNGFVWQLLPRAAQAFEQLGWVEEFSTPDEVVAPAQFIEGATSRITVNAYERNPAARRKCIEAYGSTCCICGFSFGDVYGPLVDGLIHIHHKRPLSQCDEEYAVDPIEDLRPVCPNCHAVIHHKCLRSIEDVQQLLALQRQSKSIAPYSPTD